MRKLMIGSALVSATFIGALSVAQSASAQSVENFYKGQTIRIIVGNEPGGGYDMTSRILARHMGKYIPGKPNIVVQNMSGAGGVKAANSVYNVSPADGLTIAAVAQHIPMYQILGGESAQYDPVRFMWLGSIGSFNSVTFAYIPTSGIKTIDDAKTKELLVAGAGVTTSSNIYGNVLNALFGTKLKLINGYSGMGNVYLAIERGELNGSAGGAYESLLQQKPEWVKENKVAGLVQVGTERAENLPDVPLLTELAKTEEQQQITSLTTMPAIIGYNHWLRPGTPADRVQALREAYEATAKDPDFISEMSKTSYEVRFRKPAELEEAVRKAAQLPKPVLEKTKSILGW